MDITRKVSIVTGSSRGIGREIAISLAKAGSYVVINYNNNQKSAEETQQLIKNHGGRSIVVKADVSNYTEAETLVKSAIEHFGKIDVVVNNAGILHLKNFKDMTQEEWEETYRINVFGTYNVTHNALQHMKSGVIINMTSVAASRMLPLKGRTDYSGTKAALIAFTKTLATELAPEIRVMAIAPGPVRTDMGSQLPTERLKAVPMGRLIEPDEVSKAIHFIIDNDILTGQVIDVNGGE